MLITVAALELCSSCLPMPLPPPPFSPSRSHGRDKVTMNTQRIDVRFYKLEGDAVVVCCSGLDNDVGGGY